ncbi:BTAD domain-containing putative transcriptional regulator [Thermotoga sp. Ku-13t]|uniref:AfsR/SARP family transcriptional regulator n=1 Tax=Thermotoga sp. Ku-13t TaxID=1755813 RepID=UPI0013ED2CFC|nr:BTAD domain-containing putative transcriptional regulator [Thermotoga sp. Ku-13t]
MLRYFVVFHRRRIPKEVLFEMFWPGMEENYACRNLQTAISMIRRFLGKDLLTYRDGTYCFDENGEVSVDAEEFEKKIARARSCSDVKDKVAILKCAVDEYLDDVLIECGYEDWAMQAREHYKDLLIEALLELIAFHEAKNEYTEVCNLAKRVLEKDPYNESACMSLLKAMSKLGQELEALSFYRSFASRMEKELGVIPSQELRDLYEHLLAQRKRTVWIITIETDRTDEVIQHLKGILRETDAVKIFSKGKLGIFIRDVDDPIAKSIQKRIELALKQCSSHCKISLRKAR